MRSVRIPLVLLLSFSLVIFAPDLVHAQWPTDGRALSTAGGDQSRPAIVSDGAGGAIVAWHDGRGSSFDIYAQHLLSTGEVDPDGDADGVLLCGAANFQELPTIASDGAGGAFVAWQDFRSGTSYDIYAQHVLGSGAVDPDWPADGLAISTDTGYQLAPTIVADGSGGAIVTWFDQRAGSYDIYAQRVLPTGAVDPDWPAGGTALCSAAGTQRDPFIVADGAGGAIVTWFDHRDGSNDDIYAQHVLASGVVDAGWPTDGRALCTATDDQIRPKIVSDAAGGAIVTWIDYRSGNDDIYAQRVLSSGVVDPGWPADGRGLCIAANGQYDPMIVSDGAGGAIVTWWDLRSGDYDVYAQRVLATGAVAPGWPANGRALTTAPSNQQYPTIVQDGAGGAIVTWSDFQPVSTYDIYAQHLLSTGAVDSAWPVNGRALCNAGFSQEYPVVASDGAGGALVAWQDFRNESDYDVYAQRVSAGGVVGPAADPPWTPNGDVVIASSGLQTAPAVVGDQQGGAIIAWQDYSGTAARGSGPGTLGPGAARGRAIRVPEGGGVDATWPSGGTELTGVSSVKTGTVSVSDGLGGSIVVWQDERNGNVDVYAQRVRHDGTIAAGWPANGAVVCTEASNQTGVRAVASDANGVIVCWSDARAGVGNENVFAQRLIGDGSVAPGWPVDGLALCTASGAQTAPAIVTDDAGGAVVAWADRRAADADIYALRITPAATVAPGWTANGVGLCTQSGDQTQPDIGRSVPGGAIVAWSDARGADRDIYAQRVEPGGSIAAGWPAQGAVLCLAADAQTTPRVVSDGAGGAIVGWEDSRSIATSGVDLYAQRIESSSTIAPGWTPNGVAVCTAPADQEAPRLVADGVGGAIASWQDERNLTTDIYANQVTGAGAIDPRWGADGLPLCATQGSQLEPVIAADGQGGAIVAWTDGRNDAGDIYALRIQAETAPVPTAVPSIGQGTSRIALAVWPNPTSGAAWLRLRLPAPGRVTLRVHDLAGRAVRDLASTVLEAGEHVVRWDGRDQQGKRLPPGVYAASGRYEVAASRPLELKARLVVIE